ncbi:hypothetical protein HKD37_01G000158 [Glycine soja]
MKIQQRQNTGLRNKVKNSVSATASVLLPHILSCFFLPILPQPNFPLHLPQHFTESPVSPIRLRLHLPPTLLLLRRRHR